MVDAAKFVTEWQKAENIQALVKKFGMGHSALSGRATNYRKKGIELKKFAGGKHGVQLDIEGLNKLAKANGPADAHKKRKKIAAKSVKKAK
jgi:hypothetical protein